MEREKNFATPTLALPPQGGGDFKELPFNQVVIAVAKSFFGFSIVGAQRAVPLNFGHGSPCPYFKKLFLAIAVRHAN